jgi:hypothetical protein
MYERSAQRLFVIQCLRMSASAAAACTSHDERDADSADTEEAPIKINNVAYVSWHDAFKQAEIVHGRSSRAKWWKTTNIVVIDIDSKEIRLQCDGCNKFLSVGSPARS